MNIGIVAFSIRGGELGRLLEKELHDIGCETEGFIINKYSVAQMKPFEDLNALTCVLFEKEDLIFYIGATGIAVRAIAPFVKSKLVDPGIIVVDETGKYVISLLSGHIGRANYFTRLVAQMLSAEAVITTATDCNHVFAVDDWAVENGLKIVNPVTIKEISSRLLANQPVGFFSDIKVRGLIPKELREEDTEAGILISYDKKRNPFPITCHLLPMDLVVGIGCKKGKAFTELEAFLLKVFEHEKLDLERIGKICSISIKADEAGLIHLSKKLHVPYETFQVKQLQEAVGIFEASDFVEKHAGIDNVCERSACLGSGNGLKIVKKQVFDGMTLAVYQRKFEPEF